MAVILSPSRVWKEFVFLYTLLQHVSNIFWKEFQEGFENISSKKF